MNDSYNQMNQSKSVHLISEEDINQEISKVFLWMFFGLLTTAMTAYTTTLYPDFFYSIMEAVQSPFIYILIMISPVLLIRTIVNRADLTASAAASLFLVYSAFFGLFLGNIFYRYTAESLFSTLLVTSLTFLSMAIYGYYTKKDLTKFGTMLIIAMWGMFLGFIINLFLQNPLMHTVYCGIGVIVFLGLTAYDLQRMKSDIIEQKSLTGFYSGKSTILNSFLLYLNFINIFLLLLNFMGDRD